MVYALNRNLYKRRYYYEYRDTFSLSLPDLDTSLTSYAKVLAMYSEVGEGEEGKAIVIKAKAAFLISAMTLTLFYFGYKSHIPL